MGLFTLLIQKLEHLKSSNIGNPVVLFARLLTVVCSLFTCWSKRMGNAPSTEGEGRKKLAESQKPGGCFALS